MAIALLLVAAGPLYVIFEAIAALGFRPPYNYATYFISDLGIPYETFSRDLPVDSRLAVFLNAGLILHGILFALAAMLAFRAADPGWARRGLLTLAVLHGVGVCMVALWHGGPREKADGTIAFHGFGALLAIMCGNALIILVGCCSGRYGAPRNYRIYCVASGVIAIASGLALILSTATVIVDYPGIPERISVYNIMLWDLMTGILILNAIRHNPLPHRQVTT